MELYDTVKYLLNRHDKTIAQFSEDIGIGKTSIYKWKTQTPSMEVVSKIADYFNVSIDYVVKGPDAPDWASKEDIYDLDEMLNNNVHMAYGGEELTDEEKQRVKDVLTTIFWDKKRKKK